MSQNDAYFALKLFDSMLNWLYFGIYFQIKNSGFATVRPRYNISVPDFNLMSVTADLQNGGLTIWPYQKIQLAVLPSSLSRDGVPVNRR